MNEQMVLQILIALAAGALAGGVGAVIVGGWLNRRKSTRVDEHAAVLYPACAVCGSGAGRSCTRLVCERYIDQTWH